MRNDLAGVDRPDLVDALTREIYGWTDAAPLKSRFSNGSPSQVAAGLDASMGWHAVEVEVRDHIVAVTPVELPICLE